MHPFPHEHDQQQAEAIDILKGSEAFILVHFKDGKECDSPVCAMTHRHRVTTVIASCSHQDLHYGMEAIQDEIAIITSVNTLMALNPDQRNQIAEIIRGGETAFYRLDDDEA